MKTCQDFLIKGVVGPIYCEITQKNYQNSMIKFGDQKFRLPLKFRLPHLLKFRLPNFKVQGVQKFRLPLKFRLPKGTEISSTFGVWLGQVSLYYVKLGQVRLVLVRLGMDRIVYYFRLRQVILVKSMIEQDSSLGGILQFGRRNFSENGRRNFSSVVDEMSVFFGRRNFSGRRNFCTAGIRNFSTSRQTKFQ